MFLDASHDAERNMQKRRGLEEDVRSERADGGLFGSRREEGAQVDIVRARGLGFERLCGGVGGTADEEIRRDETGGFCREIALPEMNAVGTAVGGDVDVIVHDHQHAVSVTEFPELESESAEIPVGKSLFPELDDFCAALSDGVKNLQDASSGSESACDHRVEIRLSQAGCTFFSKTHFFKTSAFLFSRSEAAVTYGKINLILMIVLDFFPGVQGDPLQMFFYFFYFFFRSLQYFPEDMLPGILPEQADYSSVKNPLRKRVSENLCRLN